MEKGAYYWAEGRFETLYLDEGHWTGIWIQEGNDSKGGFGSHFQVAHRLLKGSGGILALGIIMVRFHPVEPSGWPDLLLFLLHNERAKGVLLVFSLNPA